MVVISYQDSFFIHLEIERITECDVYKSEEINEAFSVNTCSNVINNIG